MPNLPRDSTSESAPARRLRGRAAANPNGPALVFGGAAAAAFIVLAVASRTLPHAGLVPAMVALLFALAALSALLGWWSRQAQRAARLTYWDVAGALVFIGIGLSVLIEPENLIQVVDARIRSE